FVSSRSRHTRSYGDWSSDVCSSDLGKITTVDYLVPARKPTPPVTVQKIFPSGDVLPANHLRFHIYFSKPMRGGQDMFEQIKLLRSEERRVGKAGREGGKGGQ